MHRDCKTLEQLPIPLMQCKTMSSFLTRVSVIQALDVFVRREKIVSHSQSESLSSGCANLILAQSGPKS